MRTTVDLPDDLHGTAMSIARDRGHSLSRTVADLVRAGLRQQPGATELEFSPVSGLPVVRVGHVVTEQDVAAWEDEQ